MANFSVDPQHRQLIASGAILKLELAEFYATRSWKPAFRTLIERLRDGELLESIATSESWKAPQQFRALLNESLQVADPARLILDVVRKREQAHREWRSLLGTLIYPSILLMAALAVALAFGFFFTSSTDTSVLKEFGIRGQEYAIAIFEDQRNALIGASIVFAWSLFMYAAVLVVGPKWSVLAIIGGLPLIGGPCRWLGLSELLGRVELFTRQGMTLFEAIRAVGNTYHASGLAVAAEAACRRVESGMLFGHALKQSMLSDGLCRPALGLLDQGGVYSHEQLRRVSELLQMLAAKRCRLLAFVMPTILFLAVGSIIGNAFNSYFAFFLTIVSLISSLA